MYNINGGYYKVNKEDLTDILNDKELEFFSSGKIPYSGGADLWRLKCGADKKIIEAIKNNEINFIKNEPLCEPKKSLQIISKDGFDAFQSPCDSNVIITSERQRQDDLKKNDCIDAREFIPEGKTSLLDAKP